MLPPPEVLIAIPGGPLGHLPQRNLRYEAGGITFAGNKSHALRPGGYADALDRRPTLCGLRRAPTGRPFVFVEQRSCLTCDAVAQLRPARRSMRVSSELAAYRAQLDNVATRLARARSAAGEEPPDVAHRLLHELLNAA